MIRYVAQNGPWQQGISCTGFVSRAQNAGGGPVPMMAPGGVATNLGQGQHGVIPIGAGTNKLVAFGLLTCAAVVLASTDPNAAPLAAVYHAPSGNIAAGMLATLTAALGNPAPATMVALYVTPKPWDPNYQADALSIEAFGVPPNRVAYMDNLPAAQFGISSIGQVGI